MKVTRDLFYISAPDTEGTQSATLEGQGRRFQAWMDDYREEVAANNRNPLLSGSGQQDANREAADAVWAKLESDESSREIRLVSKRIENIDAALMKKAQPILAPESAELRREVRAHFRDNVKHEDPIKLDMYLDEVASNPDRRAARLQLGALWEDPLAMVPKERLEGVQRRIANEIDPAASRRLGQLTVFQSYLESNMQMARTAVDRIAGLSALERQERAAARKEPTVV
jgi:hypothetical protein